MGRVLSGVSGVMTRGGDPPVLELLPEVVVLLVQAHDLAVPAAAHPAQVDRAVHRHQVALEDVGLVVDLAIGVLAEAAPADGQDHPEREVRAEGEHQPATAAGRTAGTAR